MEHSKPLLSIITFLVVPSDTSSSMLIIYRAASLKTVLEDLAEQMSSGQLSLQQITQLSNLVEGCRKVLEDLDSAVKKYGSLDTNASGLGPKTEKVWKKLKWDPRDVDALRLRLISNTTILDTFSSGIAR